jgi:hypothetical protein
MDQNEIPHDPRHRGVQSGASKTFFEPVVCLAQTVHLTYLVSRLVVLQMHRIELPLEPCHLGDEAQVDAHFGLFGDSANLDARWVHGLRRTYHRLRNHFGRTRWISYVILVM